MSIPRVLRALLTDDSHPSSYCGVSSSPKELPSSGSQLFPRPSSYMEPQPPCPKKRQFLKGCLNSTLNWVLLQLPSNCTPSSAQPDYLHLLLNPKIGHAPASASPALGFQAWAPTLSLGFTFDSNVFFAAFSVCPRPSFCWTGSLQWRYLPPSFLLIIKVSSNTLATTTVFWWH